MADSAAATVKISNAKSCPVGLNCAIEIKIKFKFAANNINSNANNNDIKLRLFNIKPASPIKNKILGTMLINEKLSKNGMYSQVL